MHSVGVAKAILHPKTMVRLTTELKTETEALTTDSEREVNIDLRC